MGKNIFTKWNLTSELLYNWQTAHPEKNDCLRAKHLYTVLTNVVHQPIWRSHLLIIKPVYSNWYMDNWWKWLSYKRGCYIVAQESVLDAFLDVWTIQYVSTLYTWLLQCYIYVLYFILICFWLTSLHCYNLERSKLKNQQCSKSLYHTILFQQGMFKKFLWR